MSFICDQCEARFNHQKSIRRHKQSVHGDIKFHCDQCPYSSKWKDNLVRHKVSKHRERPIEADAPPSKKLRIDPPTRPSVI